MRTSHCRSSAVRVFATALGTWLLLAIGAQSSVRLGPKSFSFASSSSNRRLAAATFCFEFSTCRTTSALEGGSRLLRPTTCHFRLLHASMARQSLLSLPLLFLGKHSSGVELRGVRARHSAALAAHQPHTCVRHVLSPRSSELCTQQVMRLWTLEQTMELPRPR